jgi:glycosyltransferase involved in cell wall biosynthesis
MRIVILTERPFPYGMAATTRMVAYARGMIDAGADVSVLCTKPTETPGRKSINTETEGDFEGIHFKYTPGTTVRSSSAFRRVIHYYSGFFRAKKELRRMQERAKIDVMFMGLSNFWFTWSHARWSRRNKVLFVQERSEYPFIGISGPWQSLKLMFYLRITCKLFDAIVIITRALEAYFSRWIRKGAGIYLLPMLVEAERFRSPDRKPEGLPGKYIAYVGDMQGDKDGVPILIESFARISASYPEMHLVLIGDTRFEGFEGLRKRVEDKGLSDRVHFTGRLERDELPAFLGSADYLALARPSSRQAEGGFPNKLGEYLATGKAVVVTSVGEIPEFLTDGENAFVSVPDDVQAFADKLKEALDDPARAKLIGERGRKLVDTVFHPGLQAGRMLEYFHELKKSTC